LVRIEACFDSHVHWPFTGELAQRLRLGHLVGPDAIRDFHTQPQHLRGEWLLGFGWDDTKWSTKPHRTVLDEWFPNGPVALSRCDGHALWVNTEALKRAGLWDNPELVIPGGRIERDTSGRPTGVLVDQAMDPVNNKIDKIEALEVRRNLLGGMRAFNLAGYTHIRDMTCDERQWQEAVKMDQSGVLTLAVEEYFWLKSFDDLEITVDLVKRARDSQTENLRARGIKLFLDGALGSEGAYLSRCYHGSHNKGLLLWESEALKSVLRKAWEDKIEVAVHVIGDEAGDMIVDLAQKLKQEDIAGPLHLEHCELLRSETIQKMRGLEITCHIQPSHWLSDRKWLKKKLGDLNETAFQWRKLQEAEIPFYFGSDSPIEPASIPRLLQALRDSSEEGVPRLLGQPMRYMGHPDLSWAPNSYTIVEEEVPAQVVFRGEHLL
jgi:predicted amidohydrolase YtcJ